MREIKFRGKSLDSGEWYYGNLYDKDTAGRTHICTTKKGCLNIDPETVGQFTGLKDKNGKEIYEGDVVRLYGVVNYPACIVKFYLDRFVMERPNGSICPLREELGIGGPACVIGNIHDNPNLLK